MGTLRIVIAGGAGFIGSHLSEFFLDRGHSVVCLDNFSTSSLTNIAHLSQTPGFTFLETDVVQPQEIPGRIDWVLNLASPASPVHYQRLPLETLRAGSIGTWNLLELARAKEAKFLLTSTSEVYGDPTVHPQDETYWGYVNPIGPRSVYDESKRFAEALTMAYHRSYAVDVRLARLFNTYGPRMQMEDGRVIPNFVLQALRGQPLTVYGDGSQTRSFCYLSDMLEGLYSLMMSNESRPVNLGNPHEVTIRELAGRIISITGGRSQIVSQPLPEDDPKQRCPDISRAIKVLGWQPRISLEEGLNKAVPWFASQI